MKKTLRIAAGVLFLTQVMTLHAVPPRTAESASTPVEMSRHAQILQQIKEAKGNFNFVLIGDSITEGWPVKGSNSYAAFLPWKPLNLGVSREATENVLYRVTNGELDGLHPKAVMILIGTNNLGNCRDEKPEWAAGGVKKIVEVVREKCPGAKILLMAIFPRNDKANDPIRQKVVATNKLIAPLGDNKTVFFMDIGDRFTDAQGNLNVELLPDKLHPSPAGFQVWLDAIKPKLDEWMK